MDNIREALWDLTKMREKWVKQNDVLGRLFPSEGLTMKQTDIDDRIYELEQHVVPGFHVWYEPNHKCYVLVPKFRDEGEKE